jgi:hypothetical protein
MSANVSSDDVSFVSDLERRITSFDRLAERFKCDRPSGLIAVHDIGSSLWERLVVATGIYMARCLPDDQLFLDGDQIIDAFESRRDEIGNVTPNGMIVPKRHTILEYNALVRAFAQIVDSLGIADLIASWHVPLNLRIKFGEVDQENMRRHHPTEHIHSDSWAGESAESVTVHMPIFGDVDRNRMVFYDPPEEFEEEWLGPIPSYLSGSGVADKYSINKFAAKAGQVVLADFAGLHASTRFEGACSRVSIDTTFALKRDRRDGASERIHPWRTEERASPEVLAHIGETHLFVFPDRVEQRVDSKGGFKHPTNLRLIELLD